MGSSRKGWKRASSSSYEITFMYRGKRCRERVRIKPSPANDKRVERFRAAVIDSIERGTFDYAHTFPDSKNAADLSNRPGHAVTVGEYLERWLERAREQVAASTFRDYRNTVHNNLIPAFGNYRLGELRRGHVRDWAASLGASNKRIGNLLSPLRLAFRDALDDGLVETNPLHNWTYRRRERRRDYVDPFSAEEQRAILAALPAGSGRNLFQFAFWTGMRTSELVALEWTDVDWRRETVRVQRGQAQGAKEPEDTKTPSGAREVRLLPPAMEALKAQQEHSRLHPSGRIWLNPRTGEPWTGDQPIRKTLWQPALQRAGVRYRNPYQTRHTYASMMLSVGEPPRWVADQMGHADLHMVFQVYSRWIPDAMPQAGSGAVSAFWWREQESNPVPGEGEGGPL